MLNGAAQLQWALAAGHGDQAACMAHSLLPVHQEASVVVVTEHCPTISCQCKACCEDIPARGQTCCRPPEAQMGSCSTGLCWESDLRGTLEG